MTGRFDTYIYTNCRADEGLQHRDGFQFQAISPGADQSAMPVVQRSLLYEPAPQWMRERRPVADYPPSLAHVFSGVYATAAGVYLGRESSGGREGNQLTHALATADPGAYGLVRPAQLFGAGFWTTVPAPAQQCPALEEGWEPGPFGVPEAQRFVRGQERGAALLTTLLAELRRTDKARRRVLFVAHDPELVLRWVTAATILIPHRQALGIDFKVFTLNPAYADHRILAVHPDWSASSASLDNQLGYAVIDLVRHAWSPGPRDPDSRRWVDLFLNEDPYDVADAVEVAAEGGIPGPAGAAFATAVVLGRPPEPDEVAPIVTWLYNGPIQLVRRYGRALVDQLLTSASDWPTSELIRLDAAVGRSLMDRAAAVRLALLRAELAVVSANVLVRHDRLPAIEAAYWDEAADTAAIDLLADAMRPAVPDQFELLLRLAGRFRVQPPLALLEPGLQRFIEHWAGHPEVRYDPRPWANGADVEAKLRGLLERRLTDRPALFDQLGDDWWDELLTDQVTLQTTLDAAVVAAAIAAADETERFGVVEQLLHAAQAAADPESAFRQAAAALWRRSTPTPAEARRLCHLAPDDLRLGPEHFRTLTTALDEDEIKDDEHRAAYQLVEVGHLWAPSPETQTRLWHHTNIRWVIGQLGRTSVDSVRLGEVMAKVPPAITRSYRKPLLAAMTAAPLTVASLAVLTRAPELRAPLAGRIADAVRHETWHPAQMTMAFVLVRQTPPDPSNERQAQIWARLERALSDFLMRTSSSRLEEVTALAGQLDEPWPSRWTAYLRSMRPRGPIGRIIQRGR